MSKGSNRRPTDEDKFKANFDLIFRKPKPEPRLFTKTDNTQNAVIAPEKPCPECKTKTC
jgi:hypothetical protein